VAPWRSPSREPRRSRRSRMSSGPSPDPGSEDPPAVRTGRPITTDRSPEPGTPQLDEGPEVVEAPSEGEPSDGPTDEPLAPAKPRRKRRFGFVKELPFLLLVAFGLALLIKTFLVQAFFIPSESMENTLNPGDRVLVNKVVYHLHPPRRGDIIVFSDPNPPPQADQNPVQAVWHWLTEGLGVTTSPEKDFIKRVIGLPGETIEGRDGLVYVDGKPLEEPYVRSEDSRPFGPVRVPRDSLFVMGDNRTDSKDSRYGLGFIPYDNVIGRAFVVIWPPARVGWLRGT
jgi:signal peptidase I